MSPNKKSYKIKKQLAKTIKRLLIANRGLSPQNLLESNIQTSSGLQRFLQGLLGLSLVILSITLFFNIDKNNPLSLAFLPTGFILIPIGGFLIWKSLHGKKKKVKEFLKELSNSADVPADAFNDIDITKLVENAFKESSTKFKGGGGEFGGGGVSRNWDNNSNDIHINLPDISENIHTPLSDIPVNDVGDVGEIAGEIASNIIEGIFSSISI